MAEKSFPDEIDEHVQLQYMDGPSTNSSTGCTSNDNGGIGCTCVWCCIDDNSFEDVDNILPTVVEEYPAEEIEKLISDIVEGSVGDMDQSEQEIQRITAVSDIEPSTSNVNILEFQFRIPAPASSANEIINQDSVENLNDMSNQSTFEKLLDLIAEKLNDTIISELIEEQNPKKDDAATSPIVEFHDEIDGAAAPSFVEFQCEIKGNASTEGKEVLDENKNRINPEAVALLNVEKTSEGKDRLFEFNKEILKIKFGHPKEGISPSGC